MFQSASDNLLRRDILAGVDDVESVVAQQQADDVLADIVDIALYCCKDYLALRNAFFTR